jgi:hypothetical protein
LKSEGRLAETSQSAFSVSLSRGVTWAQAVSVAFVVQPLATLAGVEFDDRLSGRAPSTQLVDIHRRDWLGRMALMRAALRGHADLL